MEFGTRIQVDEKLNDELKDDQGQVFLYFEFDQNTRTAFKPSEEEYQVANGHPIYWLIAGGMVLGYWAVTNLIDSQERIKQEELEIQKQELEIQKQELELKRQEVEESITFESEESIDID